MILSFSGLSGTKVVLFCESAKDFRRIIVFLEEKIPYRFFHVAGHNCSKRQYDTKEQKDYHLVINTFINNYIYYILYYNIIYNIYNLR